MTATRVLIVDDHELARRGLEAMLRTAEWIEVVGEAGDCATGLARTTRLRPDIVLLDINLPGTDGLACLSQMKVAMPEVAVIIVTLYDNRQFVLEALRRGAAGYLLKDATARQVLSTLRQVVDGQLAIDAQLLREALTEAEVAAAPAAPSPSSAYALTPRERDVLALVAEGFTNKEIGGRLGIAEDTVKKHVQNVIWKLHASDRTHAAILALKLGLLDQEP